jgi:hypothetical protein
MHRANIVFAMITSALQRCDESFHDEPSQSKRFFEAAMRMATVALQVA